MHAPKFLTSGKIRFNRVSEASHLARNAADTFCPARQFPGNQVKFNFSTHKCRLGLVAQTGVSQACGKKNCYGNGAGNQP
jgi:hypothetical protein